jgi:hypothetical protein
MTGAWFQRRSYMLARDAFVDPPNGTTLATLAGLLSGTTKTPVGAVPDRIRAALDKSVKLGAKGEEVSFEKATEVLMKQAGLDVHIRYGPGTVKFRTNMTIMSEGEELPLGAWLQLIEDHAVVQFQPGKGREGILVTRHRFYLRDYGLLFAAVDSAPPDAPTLTEFWKQKPLEAKDPETMLKFLEFKRTELSTKYGPNHPDLIALNRQIEILQKEQQDRRNQPKK